VLIGNRKVIFINGRYEVQRTGDDTVTAVFRNEGEANNYAARTSMLWPYKDRRFGHA